VLTRLKQRLPLLTGGARDLPARQQTLRNAIAWSYDLLEPWEQMLFRRMAVFVRGCTLEAAEAVCAAGGDLPFEVLDGVAALMDKSLLRQEIVGGETRFWILATIREYALERLNESGEAERLRAAHRAWFRDWAETADQQLRGSEQVQWLERLEAEHDNLRVALTGWQAAEDGAEATLRMAGALGFFWDIHGYWSEGRRWLDAALTRPGAEAPTRARAYALYRAAVLVQDPALIRARLEESVAIWRALDDKQGLAYALDSLGEANRLQGDLTTARAVAEETLELFTVAGDARGRAASLFQLGRIALEQDDLILAQDYFEQSQGLLALGDKRGRANCLYQLGRTALAQGDYVTAEGRISESLELRRELGDANGIGWSLNGLGEVARYQGDYARAGAYYEEGMGLFWALGFKRGVAMALHNLAYVAQAQGDLERATALFGVSLVLSRELGNKRGLTLALAGLAAVASEMGQPERAARLFGAADTLLSAMGAAIAPADRAIHDRYLAATQTQMDPAAFAATWSTGQTLPLEQVIAYAVEEPGDA
jgi:tetratricopeptide (TPR) repeat protein